jgi:hypothetical protein
MSDIPLHSLRRNKTGYIPIARETDDYSNSANSTMPTAAVGAAASSASRKGILRAKQKQRYKDNPEEAASLLGEDQLDDDADLEERQRLERELQVRCIIPNPLNVFSYPG